MTNDQAPTTPLYTNAGPLTDRRHLLAKAIELLLSWSDVCGRAACDFRGVEHGIRSQMRRLGRQHLLFAVHQIRRVEARQLESVAVGDGVGRARLHAVSAKNAAV